MTFPFWSRRQRPPTRSIVDRPLRGVELLECRRMLATYEFAAATMDSSEDSTVLPRVLVSGLVSGVASLDISTGGTASPLDYSLSFPVSIPPGVYDGTLATSIALPLTVWNDTEQELDETIEFLFLGGFDPQLSLAAR